MLRYFGVRLILPRAVELLQEAELGVVILEQSKRVHWYWEGRANLVFDHKMQVWLPNLKKWWPISNPRRSTEGLSRGVIR